MKIVVIDGSSIEDVWFKAIKACINYGYVYTIDEGEYKGQKRKELDFAVLKIKTPYIRPLACQSQYISPTTDEKIKEYFSDYLMNSSFNNKLEEQNNEYKYSSWIEPSWQHCCDKLIVGEGGCNQATITLGNMIEKQYYTHTIQIDKDKVENKKILLSESHVNFDQPPCLRVIDMRIRYNKLHFILYFRSWDLVAGYPQNIGGLQLLKEWCLDYINMNLEEQGKPKLEDGEIIASSKGLHVYDHFFKIVEDYVGTSNETINFPGINII